MLNLKFALRTLFKTPFVTIVAIVSLALGIGANAAIFSLFDQLLLKPLAVAAPDRLVNFAAPGPKPGSTSCNQAGDCDAVFSYPMFRDLQAANTGFSGIAAHVLFGANLAYQGVTASDRAPAVPAVATDPRARVHVCQFKPVRDPERVQRDEMRSAGRRARTSEPVAASPSHNPMAWWRGSAPLRGELRRRRDTPCTPCRARSRRSRVPQGVTRGR